MGQPVDTLGQYQKWQDYFRSQAQTGEEQAHIPLIGAQTGETVARTGLIGQQQANEAAKIPLIGAQVRQTLAGIPLTAAQAALTGAQVGKVGAETEDVRQQAIGRSYNNALTYPAIPAQQAIQAAGAATPAQEQSLPWNRSEGAAASSSVLPPRGGAIGAPPQQQQQQQQPADLYTYAIGTSPVNQQQQQQQTEQSVPLDANGLPQRFTSPKGMIYGGMVIPKTLLPSLVSPGLVDRSGAEERVRKIVNSDLSRLIVRAQEPDGTVNPEVWNATVRQAYDMGLIDNIDSARYYGHPERMPMALQSLLPPNELAQIKAQEAEARRSAENRQTLIQQDVTNPQAGTTTQQPMSAADVLSRVRQNATGTATSQAESQPVGSPLYQRVMGSENRTGNPAQNNQSGPGGRPTSSAMGNGQWTETTWRAAMHAYAPELAKSVPDAQLQMLRGVPEISAAAFDAYAPALAAQVQRAFPNQTVTNAAVGLAHRYGGGGAVTLLSAAPGATLQQLLPDAAAANPRLANQTAGTIVRQAGRDWGVEPFRPFVAPLPTATGAAAVSPTAPPPAAQTAPAEQLGSSPKPSAYSEGALRLDTGAVERDAAIAEKNLDEAHAASNSMPLLYDMRQKLPSVPTGAFGTERTAIANFLQTFGGDWANKFTEATTGLDPSKASDMQEFNKQTFANVVNGEQQLHGARVGAMLTKYFQQAQPNINMQQPAIKDMTGFMLVARQLVKDYGTQSADFFNQSRDDFQAGLRAGKPTPYQTLNKFDAQWLAPTSVHAPAVYEGAALALNGKSDAPQFRRLTPEQQTEAVRIALRADPTARFGTPKPAAAGVQ